GRLADAAHALALVTYFFPPDAVLESLASFPVAAIAIDVRSRDTTAFERLDALRTKYVLLGVVDARNTRLVTAEEGAGKPERARRARAQGDRRVDPPAGGHRPRRARRWRDVSRRHGGVLRGAARRIQDRWPRPLVWEPLLPQADHRRKDPQDRAPNGEMVPVR